MSIRFSQTISSYSAPYRSPPLSNSEMLSTHWCARTGALLAMLLACSQPHRANCKLPALALTSGSPSLLAQTASTNRCLTVAGTVSHGCNSVRHIRTFEGRGRDSCTSSPYSRRFTFRIISLPPLRGVATSSCMCVVLNQHLDQSQSNSLQMGHGFRSTLLATRFIVGMTPLVGSGSPWVCVERPAPVAGPPRCSG